MKNASFTLAMIGLTGLLAACGNDPNATDLEVPIRDACTKEFFTAPEIKKGAVLDDSKLVFHPFAGADSGAVTGSVTDIGGDQLVATPGWIYCEATVADNVAHVDLLKVSDDIISR